MQQLSVSVFVFVFACLALLSSTQADYVNPNDKYQPGSLVKAGHAFSGQEFGTSMDYIRKVLIPPVVLFVLGVLSLIVLILLLCCRRCFKCLRCEPNDHHNEAGHDQDSVAKRIAYINHQKTMIFVIEIVLCLCVLIADALCFYGYKYIMDGGHNLTDALDKMKAIVTSAIDGSATIGLGATYLKAFVLESSTTLCPAPASGPYHSAYFTSMTNGYATLDSAADMLISSMASIGPTLSPLSSQIDTLKAYVVDYLLKYADIFVIIIFCIALLSVLLFVVFRMFKSQLGTKFAIFWGMLTFFLLLLICLPFMIFSSVFGDFCMAPTENAIKQVPDDLKDTLTYYATCVGSGDVTAFLMTGLTQLQTLLTQAVGGFIGEYDPVASANTPSFPFNSATCGSPGSYVPCYCNSANAPRSTGDIGATGNPSGMAGVLAASIMLQQGVQQILDGADCSKLQEIWFIVINDALCTNFYNGIYSLWVSQFITSFFLFFLIVLASISYHYFKDAKTYVSPTDAETVLVAEGGVEKNAQGHIEMAERGDVDA